MRLSSCVIAAAALGAAFLATAGISAQAGDKFKVFLSMSYIGNDWQAEAANMVKAMADHTSLRDKVDLTVQVAGPNAQRQIQQINAMVQSGAKELPTLEQATGHADARLRRKLFGSLSAILRQDLGNGMAELEPPSIGPVSFGVQLGDSRQALLE